MNMITLILATLDFAATQFVMYAPWVKAGDVDADHFPVEGSYAHMYIHDLQYEFLAVKEGGTWIAFYTFMILAFATSVLGLVSTLVSTFGSKQDEGNVTLLSAGLYGVQSIALVIAGALFHDAMGAWAMEFPDADEGVAGFKVWHTYVAPAVLWIVLAHSLALTLMNGYKLVKSD